MPRFRINETKEFPVDFSDDSIWYSIITPDLNCYDFTSSVSGKKEFIPFGSDEGYGKTPLFMTGMESSLIIMY